MVKQPPSRTQRSKGVKVKHVLQICFLLAICFWLLYQVKHSHVKKKEFDEGDTRISQQKQISSEVLKLGRKDLNSRVQDTTTMTNQEEEAEEEEKEEEEENAGEEEDLEYKKFGEKGDEQRGAGDDDTDEQEEDKSDAEADQEEDVIEEEKDKEEGVEKENEEKDSEENVGQLDFESSLDEEHDDDEQAHEAREEHYKADDASSAVTHETEVVAAENGNGRLEKSNVVNKTNESNVGGETSVSELEDQTLTENGGPLKTTDKMVSGNVESKSDDGSNDHLKLVNSKTNESNVGGGTSGSELEDRNLTENGGPLKTTDKMVSENVESKSDDGSSDHLKLVNSTLEAENVAHSLLTHNGTEKVSDFSQAGNVTTDGTISGDASMMHLKLGLGSNISLSSTENEADSNSTTDSNSGEFKGTNNSTLATMPEKLVNASTEAKDSSGSSFADTNKAGEAAESEDGSNENPEEFQPDLIDSSIGLQEKEVRTDLETLPEIQMEGNNDDDGAAE